jgi:hypothetical protein
VHKGEIHLSAVTTLAPHLTNENHRELLTAASGQSKRALAELVAARFPAPDAAALLRRLPQPSSTLAVSAIASDRDINATTARAAATTRVTAGEQSPAPVERTIGASVQVKAGPVSPATLRAPAGPVSPPCTLTPLSSQRYRLQVTLSRDGYDALRRAQELLSTADSSNDLAAVCELALTQLVERLEHRKFGKSKRPAAEPSPKPEAALQSGDQGVAVGPTSIQRTPKEAAVTNTSEPVAIPDAGCASASTAEESAPQVGTGPSVRDTENVQCRSRYIPAAVKRAVAERDNYQCFFVGADGRRCEERRHLQYHHDEVFARGGPSSVENLHLACAAHNRYRATLDFGDAWMRRVVAEKRERRSEKPYA